MPYQLQISANLLSWPRECACCGETANAELLAAASRTTGKRVQNTTTSTWRVPYCTRCLDHKREFDKASQFGAYGIICGIAVWIFLGLAVSSGLLGFVFGTVITIYGFWYQGKAQADARSLICPNCTAVGSAIAYVSWHGTFHTFIFTSKNYLHKFIATNRQKKMSDIREI